VAKDRYDKKIENMKGETFLFSTVAALEKQSKEKGGKENSQEQEDNQNDDLPRKYWPTVTYWIAVVL